MAVAHKRTTQQVLVLRRRGAVAPTLGPAWRWTFAALMAAGLYRSIPSAPDLELRTTVSQYLRFEYSRRRAPEMQARAAQHATDALLAVTDDVLNARVELEAITVRGPVLPGPLPRTAVVHVRYRVLKGGSTLEASDRYLAFGKSMTLGWHYTGTRGPLRYWLLPF
jgi:hypothetical protein